MPAPHQESMLHDAGKQPFRPEGMAFVLCYCPVGIATLMHENTVSVTSAGMHYAWGACDKIKGIQKLLLVATELKHNTPSLLQGTPSAGPPEMQGWN